MALLVVGSTALTVTQTFVTDRALAAEHANGAADGAQEEIQHDNRDLPNLTWFLSAGWDFEIVPRDDDDATVHSVPLTPTLPGNQQGTYWNSHIRNASSTDMTEGFVWRIHVDDDSPHIDFGYTTTALPGWYAVHSLNKGPRTVRGGRHTFELRIDPDNNIAESDEWDNNIAYQFVWLPYMLTNGVTITRDALPDRAGAWGAVPSSEVLWYNCDGLRFATQGWWNAVWIDAHDADDDYDCRIHEVSTGSRNGFATNLGSSTRPAGYIDAVVANRNTMGNVNWDVSVISTGAGDGDYDARWVQSESFNFGYPVDLTMPAGEAIQLWEFLLDPTLTGWVMFELEADDPVDGLWLYYYDNEFGTGGMNDYDGFGWTTDGHFRGFREITEPGYHCVAIIRDPYLGDTALDYTLNITIGRPDFTPRTPPSWHSACVPRPDTDGTPTSVDLPDTLHGNFTNTYPNIAMRNNSPVPYPDPDPYMKMYWEYDEIPLSWVGFNPIDGWDAIEYNGTVANNIPGGRHTYTLRIDKNDEINEADEENNIYGEQYCWSALEFDVGTAISRPLPAHRTAGWNTIGSGEWAYYNCDGLRILEDNNYWSAMAVMPVSGDEDVDVRLHEALVGVKDGFGNILNWSDFSWGQSDFVLVNFNETSERDFDTGVTTITGAGTYRAHSVVEEYLATYPDGTYGPYDIVSGNILDLHEMYLEAGEYLFELDNQSAVSLGMTLHPSTVAYQWKGMGVTGGIAYGSGPGADETFTVTIAATDYYCLSVWKEGSSDLFHDAPYQLHILPDALSVPSTEETPTVTRLTGVYPNPFNPQTSVAFDLAQDDFVDLCVYNLSGRRVRTLVAERTPAGSHQVQWDGNNDHGAPVPSGVYLARLIAGPVRGLEKMVLIK